MTLHVQTVGSGPDVVLLHGWGLNLAVWASLVEAWQGRFRLTLIELPGHGESEPLASSGVNEWVRACLTVAPRRAHWVGWSLGGQLALQAAFAEPERVSALGLVATTPCFVQRNDWSIGMALETFEGFAAALLDDAEATLMRFLTLQVKGDSDAKATLKQLRSGIQSRPVATPEGLRQGLALLRETDLRERLVGLRCPHAWLLGQRDTLVPAGLGDWLDTAVPEARVHVIGGAGHAPFLSHARDSLRVLNEAFDGIH
jgi:pimeloyl-[acyl-carrier protein] methyl ester esterase